jgi:hypothetical protein
MRTWIRDLLARLAKEAAHARTCPTTLQAVARAAIRTDTTRTGRDIQRYIMPEQMDRDMKPEIEHINTRRRRSSQDKLQLHDPAQAHYIFNTTSTSTLSC